MDRLIKTLQVYMYDQYDCPDVHEHDEESLVDDIIYALIQKMKIGVLLRIMTA